MRKGFALDKAFRRQRAVNLTLCFLMVFVGLGFCSANKGLYLAAVTPTNTGKLLAVVYAVLSSVGLCRWKR